MTEREIFAAALHKTDASDRAAFLDEACGGDEALRQHVESLLAEHDRLGSFMEFSSPAATHEASHSERPGTQIGSYKLLQQIGEGGMGVVYMAEQEQPVRRRVALKIIKPGMDTRQVIARFEAERQALSLMDHPNIAKVLDAGTVGEPDALARDSAPTLAHASGYPGRPYFVMELVRGTPITQYCDEHHLTPRQRLELLVPVCQAIQHAHQKGIIHRDIKPTNILVAEYDEKPVPKVIDFGVAKAIGSPLTEKTMFTGFGQLVGTLEYMSPEQAKVNQLDIDTRSDIYSLGVLMYELLTGSTPFDKHRLRSAAWDEMLRIIREEEPEKPSTRLSESSRYAPRAVDSGPHAPHSSPLAPREENGTRSVPTTLASIAAVRGTEPAKLTKLVRGELDWIVMKALEKDRNRRYETASSLVADLQHYLNDEPVIACPPSTAYRFRKFARRHKTAMAMAATVILAAFVAVGSLAMSYMRIEESLQQETRAKNDLIQSLYYQRIASAAAARKNDQAGRAEELLDQCPPHLRGWEWHYLKRLPFADFPVLQHPGVLTKLAVSRDGRLLASGSSHGIVKIWDLQTEEELHELEKHGRFIRGLAFSPNGRFLAAASEEDSGIVKLWDPSTGKWLRDLPGHASPLTALTFSRDGRFLATACQGDQVHLWDVATWRLLNTIPEKLVAFNGLAFSADGQRLLFASMEGIVKIHDVSTGQTIPLIQGSIQRVFSAAFSGTGRFVALGSEEGTVKVWETESGKEMHFLEAHTGVVMDLVFLDGDQRLATCGDDRTLKIWDMATGQEALQLGVFRKRPQSLAVSADGRRLFYRHAGDTSEVPDTIGVADGTPLTDRGTHGGTLVFTGHLHNVVAVAFSPDGRRLASASWDTTVKVWDAHTARVQFTLRGHEASLTDVAFSPDGRFVASSSWDKTVRVWDANTGQECFTLRGEGGPVHGVAYHPKDGRVLASAHNDGTIKLWDTTTEILSRNIPAQKHPVLDVAFSPDGALLAAANGKADNPVGVWNAASGERLLVLKRPAPGICSSVAFSPDSRFVAGVATTNEVYLWDLDTGEVRGRLPHPLRPNRLAFSPDGRQLVTVSLDQTVRLWDVQTNQELVGIRGHVGDVWCAAFSPDGRRLATGAGYKGHGEIRIREAALWETKP